VHYIIVTFYSSEQTIVALQRLVCFKESQYVPLHGICELSCNLGLVMTWEIVFHWCIAINTARYENIASKAYMESEGIGLLFEYYGTWAVFVGPNLKEHAAMQP